MVKKKVKKQGKKRDSVRKKIVYRCSVCGKLLKGKILYCVKCGDVLCDRHLPQKSHNCRDINRERVLTSNKWQNIESEYSKITDEKSFFSFGKIIWWVVLLVIGVGVGYLVGSKGF